MQSDSGANTCYTLIQQFVLSDSEFELFPLSLEATLRSRLTKRVDYVLSINLLTTQVLYCTVYECHRGIFPALCLHFSPVLEMNQ